MKIFFYLALFIFSNICLEKCKSKEVVAAEEETKEECIEYGTAPVHDVILHIDENPEHDSYFELYFTVKNGCGKFEKLDIKRKDKDTFFISVLAKYEGCYCTSVLKEIKEYCLIENIDITENIVFEFNTLSDINLVKRVKE